MSSKNQKNAIDEDLYSRQLYVLGHDAMKSMSESSVLISGMGGLGVELAKNVILSGVKAVTIHDTKKTTIGDLSSQYYLSEDDIGKNRAQACHTKLVELNSYVTVDIYTGELTGDFLKNFSVIVLTDSLIDEQIRINKIARENEGTKFIATSTMGLFGHIFCDFGDKFVVKDPDGEQPNESIIESISCEEKALVTCIDTKPHGLTTDCVVTFTELDGQMGDNLNGKEFTIQYVDKTSFRIDFDTSKLEPFDGSGGRFTEVKVPRIVNFKPLEESVENPEFVITNFLDFDRPNTLHATYLAFNEHLIETGKNPKQGDREFFDRVKRFNKDFNTDVVDKFVHCIKGGLCPVQAVIGGTVAQEVMKACSGKFNPINQWLYFDSFECLNENYKEANYEPFKYTNKRYNGQVSVFGREFQEKLEEQKYFVVGAGAIGCELLKNFAMIGLGSGDGKITVTDMDTIERSNLNRQFLFRPKDIGHPKSVRASNAVKKMNPLINIEAHENRVGPENEHIYDTNFFEGLDGVANALDNLQARLYMDNQCVYFKKPLLESGTLGTKGNTQVIIPHLTESYGSSSDPPEDSIPFCTVRNFPNSINHTIEWARMQFEELFENGPQNTIKYLSNPDEIKKLPVSDIIALSESIKTITDNIPTSIDDCVKWTFDLWHENYRNNIEQLLYKFPPGATTKEGGRFWSGAKKCPHPEKFDPDSDLHLDYIFATANLRASIFGIESCDKDVIKRIVTKLPVPKFTPKSDVHISVTDEEEKKKQEEKASMEVEEIIESLPDPKKLVGLKIFPAEFEKDDDTNFHIDFITCASNMRALNYKIEPISRHRTKGIAGKIIPAIATTTSIVAGLVTIELYKLVQKFDDLERYHNSFINLALPYFGFSEPIATPKAEYKGKEFTMWDSFDIRETMTLEDLINYFEKQNLELDYVNYGNLMLYSFFMPPNKTTRRMKMKIEDIIEEITGEKLNKGMVVLSVGCPPEKEDDGEEEDDVDIPPVKYYLS